MLKRCAVTGAAMRKVEGKARGSPEWYGAFGMLKHVWTARGKSESVVREEAALGEYGDDETQLHVYSALAERKA